MLCSQFTHACTHTQNIYNIHLYIPSQLSHGSPTPMLPLQVITEHQSELPVLYSSFSLVIYFTCDSVYMTLLHSQFLLDSPSPIVFTSLFFISVSPFLLSKQVHQYHFSRSHMYALIYNVTFLFFASQCITGCRFLHLNATDSNSFL